MSESMIESKKKVKVIQMAGAELGHGPSVLVRFYEESGKTDKIRLLGRELYVKKCVLPDKVGGIHQTEKTKMDHTICLVLAIGQRCGTYHSPKHWKHMKGLRNWVPSVALGVKPLDKVLCPDNWDWGLTVSPYSIHEFFIDECIVKAIIEE